jgi:5'(3')-deoxyribonucleotidase
LLGILKIKERNMKKAVIDIDNTLWHFCDVLYKRLKRINKAIPGPHKWTEWDFWEDYCSKEEFIRAINEIHLDQDNKKHVPYSESRDFLRTLKEHNFYIVIASHRTPDSIEQTHRWLVKHDLTFDELYLSHDKTVLFEEECHMVVDDAPYILEKAAEKGLKASGLMFPWNKHNGNNGYRLFNNLAEVSRYILNHSL